ncbi:MAG: hypothetical protein AAF622_15795, partial [Cyanobacteria bacterium P01_C01_bin.147]
DPREGYVVSASSDGRVLIWEREGMEDIEASLTSSCRWLKDYLAHNSQFDPEIQTLCQPTEAAAAAATASVAPE